MRHYLALLSSRFHVTWALAAGGRLGYGNDPRYNKSRCFEPFPFPDPDDPTRARLRDLGERLDAHRKRQQAPHPGLTLTQMYNVLEKLRAGEPIEGRDREIHDNGLVGILRQIHDEIDAETARPTAGRPTSPTRNPAPAGRAQPRARRRGGAGHRPLAPPEFQNPDGRAAAPAVTPELALGEAPPPGAKPDWPRALPEQMAAVREALADAGEAAPADIARRFRRGRAESVRPLLETLAALGHARGAAMAASPPDRPLARSPSSPRAACTARAASPTQGADPPLPRARGTGGTAQPGRLNGGAARGPRWMSISARHACPIRFQASRPAIL